MEELWEDIKDFPNYQISNSGKVYSKNHDRILKPNVVWSGYKMVRLYNQGWSRDFCIHRLVADHFVNNPDNKPQVNHKDGDKLNNYFLNLEYVTSSENQIHAIQTGLKKVKSKEEHGNSKLKQIDVDKIRQMYYDGLTLKQVAKVFNIHFSTVARIVNKESWK